MTKIICARTECKYCKKGQCQAKQINLTLNSIMTLNNGRQEFNTCKTFEESDLSKEMKKKFMELLKKGQEND